ncbi:MAG: outer membrane protein [Hyphomicrobiales bacterium]|uniref:outer membrane protein n=1 Tax=Nisaea sp. TaxID=2024842 RepID=UPI003273991D
MKKRCTTGSMQRRRIGFSGVAIAALLASNAARAADLPVEPDVFTPAPYEATAYDWSGAYLGAMLGYQWGDFDVQGLGDVEADGYVAGGYVGYNFQSGNLVFGIEGDLAATDLKETSGGVTLESDLTGSIRGRVGYAFDRILAYGTGGVAFADVSASDGTVSDDNWHSGYVVGAGIEAAMSENVLARVEYLYTDFGDETYNLTTATDADLSSHTVRAGIGYKF